jgi:hypothetical protein
VSEPTPMRPETGDEVLRREESARHALNEYRERRRRRRGEDTYFGSSELLLSGPADEAEERATDRRRCEILDEAEESGMSLDLAELLYDVALDEGIDPAIGFDLVRTGLGVAPPPDGVSNAPADPMVDKYLPSWMFPAQPTDQILRERMLRVSFRRLRALLEEEARVEDAFSRFAKEPDVGHFGY